MPSKDQEGTKDKEISICWYQKKNLALVRPKGHQENVFGCKEHETLDLVHILRETREAHDVRSISPDHGNRETMRANCILVS